MIAILKRSGWIGLIVLATRLPNATAQPPAGPPASLTYLTLPQALELARTNYPALRGKLAGIRAAEADAQALQLALLPQVGAQAQLLNATSNQVRGAYVSNGGLMLPISGVRTDGFRNQANWNSGVSLVVDWEAVTFGRRQARRQQARLAVEQAQADYEGDLFTHQVRVCDAYLLALNAQKAVALQTANVRRAQALQRVIRASTEGGLRPGIDSAVTNAEVARARLQALESQQVAQQQVLRLTELVGLPSPDVRLDSMAFYSRLPRAPVVAASTAQLHPQLLTFQKAIEQGRASETLARTAALPSVSVLGSVLGRGSGISEQAQADGQFAINSSLGAGLPLRAFNYIVGVTAIWHPTDLFRAKYLVSAQRERIDAVQQTYNQQALALQTAGQNAILQLDLAQARADQAPMQLDAAGQAYVQSQARYESGLDNIITLTQTTALLNRAEIDQALTTNSVWRALLLRAATVGDLTLFLQQLTR